MEHIFSLKNGHAVSADMLNDRGFCYGDGFFETIRMNYGEAELWSLHCERILYSAMLLGFIVDTDDLNILYQQASARLTLIPHAVLKLQFTRQQLDARGSYAAKSARSHVYAQAKVFVPREYRNGVALVVSEVFLPDNSLLSGIKSLNRLNYIVAANSVDLADGEQVVFFRQNGDLIETMHHNIFIVEGDNIYTPCLSSVGVNGVMRAQVLSLLKDNGQEVQVVSGLKKQNLYSADEVFITNALDGVVPISSVRDGENKKLYLSCKLNQKLTRQLSSFYGVKEKGVK